MLLYWDIAWAHKRNLGATKENWEENEGCFQRLLPKVGAHQKQSLV